MGLDDVDATDLADVLLVNFPLDEARAIGECNQEGAISYTRFSGYVSQEGVAMPVLSAGYEVVEEAGARALLAVRGLSRFLPEPCPHPPLGGGGGRLARQGASIGARYGMVGAYRVREAKEWTENRAAMVRRNPGWLRGPRNL